MIGFTLDGRSATAQEGELLVHAAARNGVFIPTLCHDDKLDPYGGCRMCVVDVEGAPRPLPACATRVTEGMEVSTNSQVPQLRKTLAEMLLSEHLNANPAGRPNELADMAVELGAEAPFVLPDAKREPYEDRNRLMGYEPDTCILCNRCVRYTQEVMQCSALSLEGRGPRGAHRADLGPLVARHRVRALRRLPLDVPDGRDLREVPRRAPVSRSASSSRRRRPARSAASAARSTSTSTRRRNGSSR